MSTPPKGDHETMWQRTMRASFIGFPVAVKLRGQRLVEGELKNPRPYDVDLQHADGTVEKIDYADVLGVKSQ